MEQGRAQALLLHIKELAGETAYRCSNGGEPYWIYNNRRRFESYLSDR
jgi:hypothetical protein